MTNEEIGEAWLKLLHDDTRDRLVAEVDRLIEDVTGEDPRDRDVKRFLVGLEVPDGSPPLEVETVMSLARSLGEIQQQADELAATLNEVAKKWNVSRNRKRDLWDAIPGDGDMKPCPGCGMPKHYSDLDKDHIVPRKLVRIDHDANIQLLCRSCNNEKGAKV